MNCWKTINLNRDYGFHRILLISFISMLLAFILLYLPMNLIYSTVKIETDGVLFFLVALIFIFPLHELLHALPLWVVRKRVNIDFKRIFNFIPVITTRSRHTFSKPLIILMLITPFLIISGLMFTACILIPGYIHYYAIIAAINFGLSVTDFIYLKLFIEAPKACLVEEIEDGYDILINR